MAFVVPKDILRHLAWYALESVAKLRCYSIFDHLPAETFLTNMLERSLKRGHNPEIDFYVDKILNE